MIREFFSPRVLLLFMAMFATLWVWFYLFMSASKKERRRGWRLLRLPLYSAIGALIGVCGVLVFLQTFN